MSLWAASSHASIPLRGTINAHQSLWTSALVGAIHSGFLTRLCVYECAYKQQHAQQDITVTK